MFAQNAGSVVDGRPYLLVDGTDPVPLSGWLTRALTRMQPGVNLSFTPRPRSGGDPGRRLNGLVATGVRLLSDIRDLYGGFHVSFMPSRELVGRLVHLEEAPWRDLDLTTSSLAVRLRKFGIRSRRNIAGTVRGYRLEDFDDVFSRYLGPSTPTPLSEAVKASELTPDLAGSSDGSGAKRPGRGPDTGHRRQHVGRSGQCGGHSRNRGDLDSASLGARRHLERLQHPAR